MEGRKEEKGRERIVREVKLWVRAEEEEQPHSK